MRIGPSIASYTPIEKKKVIVTLRKAIQVLTYAEILVFLSQPNRALSSLIIQLEAVIIQVFTL